ncbi:hypothetical protein AB0I00_31465 [Streptomyces sp. NPDC050803]|uniref:hypothetical protein n=1 Tax=unclassified Streptomyces TaxID=2593676 RepID=UPI003426F906
MTVGRASTYEEVTDPRFGEQAARLFTVERFAGMTVLTGPCPRCGQVFEFPVAEELVRDVGSDDDGDEVLVYCMSAEEFTGRPPDRTGCGAYWMLRLV